MGRRMDGWMSPEFSECSDNTTAQTISGSPTPFTSYLLVRLIDRLRIGPFGESQYIVTQSCLR